MNTISRLELMKHSRIPNVAAAFLAGLALLASPARTWAQGAAPTSDYTNTFNDITSVKSWIYWYGLGYNNTAMTWDGTMDAATNSSSGSLMVSMPFAATGDQAVWFGTFHNQYGYDGTTVYDGTKFTNITFDIHVDPASPLSANGDYGSLQLGLVQQGWKNGGTFYGSGVTIPGAASNRWVRLSQTIDQTSAGLDAVAGVDFKYTSYSGYPKAPMTFWIDNLDVHLAPIKASPPTIAAPTKPIRGLNLLSSGSNGDQYQRTNLKLINNTGTSWLGATAPVSYSFTITNFPDPVKYSGYQAHIFLVTGTSIPNYETAPDYAETNLIFLQVQENADGTGVAYLRYKVNEFQSNSNLFGPPYVGPASAGTPVRLSAPSVLGTWTLSFNQETNVTLAGPGGAVTNFILGSEIVTNFADPLNVIFGGQPNSPANFGQAVVLAAASVHGNVTPVSDNFLADASLDTTTWSVLSGDPNMVQLILPDPGALWVKWSLPDSGFGLEFTHKVTDTNSWVVLTGPDSTNGTFTTFSSAGSRFVLLPGSVLGTNLPIYLRLKQQVFTKLQVLLPGETAAPGTLTGKTGTPDVQHVGVGFSVTVNAVDNNWSLIPSITDTVHIVSTDTAALLPADAALVAGTGTFTVILQTTGTFTVTASDVTDATKSSSTSSSITSSP